MKPMDVFEAIAWVLAGILFINSLRGLSSQETARRGNGFGVAGMALAIGAILLSGRTDHLGALIGALAVGATVGGVMAQRVAMTSMPEMVAILHSFVGLAAVLPTVLATLSLGDGSVFSALLLKMLQYPRQTTSVRR